MKRGLLVFSFLFIIHFCKSQCTPPAPPTISTDNSVVCVGVGYIITSNIQGISYFFEWYKNNTIVASGINTYNPYFEATTSGVYKMRYYNISNPACYSGFSNEISISVVQKPSIQATPSSQEICSSSNTNIILSNPNNVAGTTFHWDVTEGDNVNGATSGTGNTISQTLTTYSPSTNGYIKYSIRALANGCYGPTIPVIVSVYSLPVIQTTTPTTFCEGGSVVLTGTPVGQAHAFEKDGVTINTTNSGISVSESGNYTYSISAPGTPGCTQTSTPVSVNVLPTPIAAISSATMPPTFCTGQSVTLVANPLAATGNFSYWWVKNGPTGGTVGSSQNYTANSAGSYSVRVDNKDCNFQGNYFTWATITVTENGVYGGVIGSNQRICSGGDPNSFVETSGGGASGAISYQWQSSTDNVFFTHINGATGTTYDPPPGLSATTYYRRITYSLLNSVTCTANSNTITVLVDATTGGTVGSNQTFCTSGDPTILTQSASSTGLGTSSYQWQSSLNNSTFANISGAFGTSYDPPGGLATTTYYRRVTTFSYGSFPPLTAPCTANSNTITISVNNITGGTLGSDQTLCTNGDPAAFTQSVASTGAGTLSYQWQRSLDNVAFNNIIGATSTTYDAPTGLTATTYYKRITTSTLNSVSCTATSNPITVSVNPVTGGTVGTNQAICPNGDPAAFTQTTASSGPGILSYEWKSSPDNVTYGNISGANATTYNVPGGVTQTTYYKRLTSATQNGVTCSAYSNPVTVTVIAVTGGAVAADQTICSGGNPVAFTQVTAASGPATLSYQWKKSINGTSYSNISGATAITYDAPAGLTQTTQYKRAVTSSAGGCGVSGESNIITVSIDSVNAVITPGSTTFCSGQTVSINLSTPPGSGYTYQWLKNGVNIGGATSASYLATQTGSYIVNVTTTNGCVKVSAPANVSQYTTEGTIAAFGNLCTDGYVDLTAGIGSSYAWSTSETTRTIRVYSQGTYSVNYTTSQGCFLSTSVFVEFIQRPGQTCIYARQASPEKEKVEQRDESHEIRVYPNPASHDVNIELPAAVNKTTPIEIYDAFGRVVYKSAFNAGETTKTVSTSNFADGIYMMQIITPQGSKAVRKVMVTHR